MRPITVTVGPIGAAGALSTGQQVPGGQFNLGTLPPGATRTQSFQTTASASITNGILTANTVNQGVLSAGVTVSGVGVAPGTVVLGQLSPTTWRVSPSQTVAAGALRGNNVITLDAPRQITITNTEAAGNSFTVNGTDAAGNPISETLPTTGAAVTTSQNFATVSSVSVALPMAAAAVIGTATTATSPWVMFDPWADGKVSYMAELTGVGNYTVQITNDDPNSPTNPVPPGQVVWAPDPNASMVGASASQAASWQFIPLFARVLLNSGAGSVTTTFIQPGVVNR